MTGKYSVRAGNAVCEDNQDIILTVTGEYSIRTVNAGKITRISH